MVAPIKTLMIVKRNVNIFIVNGFYSGKNKELIALAVWDWVKM